MLDVRENFLEGVVVYWNRLPREVLDSSSLEVFKRHGDVIMRGMVGKGWQLDLLI